MNKQNDLYGSTLPADLWVLVENFNTLAREKIAVLEKICAELQERTGERYILFSDGQKLENFARPEPVIGQPGIALILRCEPGEKGGQP